MKPLERRLDESTEYIRRRISVLPRIGLILGSGLGDLADALTDGHILPTNDIPNYPKSAVEGHKGNLVFSNLHSKPILAFQGRTHFYESNSIEMVLYPIYLASKLGIGTLIVTNAAGGVTASLKPGDLMLITDQINLTNGFVSHTPATANTPNGLYDKQLMEKIAALAASSGVSIKKGIYAGVKGPSYETAAEVEMVRRIGGDAVGMSTVLEVSLANRLAIKVVGLSCITNFATGIRGSKLNHSEVTIVGSRVKETLYTLLSQAIQEI